MNKHIPNYVLKTIYDIDFNKLYEDGKKIILTDLDNTLISYKEDYPSKELTKFKDELIKLGFEIHIISNNVEKRVKLFNKEFKAKGILPSACKPFTFKIKKYIKKHNMNKHEIIFVGDQLLTDVVVANKLGIDVVLVKTISTSTEKWYTKLNRKREFRILERIKKYDFEKYQKIMDLTR